MAVASPGDQQQVLHMQLPAWVFSDLMDVEARAAGTPSKDEMRLMVRALLADRFNLLAHMETKQVPIFTMVLSKPGKTGPHLTPHPAGQTCASDFPPPDDKVLPVICGGLVPMPHAPGRIAKFGARNVDMPFIANQLSAMGQLGRPVTKQTGLPGTFDFALAWAPEPTTPAEEPAPGPGFFQAVTDQLGLKLNADKGPAEFLVIDRIDHPTGN